jgi:hypothetical protein
MSFINTQDIYNKWINRNENKKFSLKLWIFSENMLGLNSLSKLMFYFVNIYLFIYEFVKHVEMVEVFYFKKEETYMNNLAIIMNFLVIEKKLKTTIQTENSSFIIILILVIQLLLYFYNCFLFLFHNKFQIENIKIGLHRHLYNITGLILLLLPYSLNYINLFILSYYDSTQNTFVYYLNFSNTIIFNLFFVIYSFLKNDVSPIENRYLFSASNPIYHVFLYFKFVFYNIIILYLTFIPGYIIFTLISLVHLINIFLIIYKFYIIHRICYIITVIKTLFFLNLFSLNLLYNATPLFSHKKSAYHNLFIMLSSVILTIVTFSPLNKLKKNFIYKLNKYEKLDRYYCSSDEFYLYYLLNKKELDYQDFLKHKYICSFIISHDCICKRTTFLDFKDEEKINQFKEFTCLHLQKLKKRPSIFDLFYLNYHLKNKKINHSLFLFLMRFKITNLNGYYFHFIVRLVKNFIKIYNYFYTSNQKPLLNKSIFNLKTLDTIILYEYNFKEFLKKIKSGLIATSRFWEIVKNKPINFHSFLSLGNEFTENTLRVCNYFGIMQSVQPNQIKLLKTYAFFIKSVVNDIEYVQYLVSLINRSLQILNPSFNISSAFIEKDFGLLIISGQSDNLFKVLSYNKFSKNFFGKKINLKKQDIHHLQPFPFNIYHLQYMKDRFDISYLSKERILYCINDQMDLNFITTNTLPCLDLEGKMNFFMTFYISESNASSMSALVDTNGCVFAATQSLKREFRFSIKCNFTENTELFQKYNGNYNNFYFSIVDFLDLINSEENSPITFPYVYNHIRECSKIFKKNTNLEEKLSTDTLIANLKDFNLISKKSSLNVRKNKLIDNLRRMGTFEKHDFNGEPITSEQIMTKIQNVTVNPLPKQSTLTINTHRFGLTEVSKDVSFHHSEIATDNAENIKMQTTIVRFKTKFNMKIVEKKVLSGLFTYYSIELSKVDNKNDKNPIILTKNRVSFALEKDEKSKNYEDNLETETYVYDKINPTSFLINYEKDEIEIHSQSKVFKLIFFSLAIIFLLLIIIYFVWFAFNIYCNNQYIHNFDISKGYLTIREKLYMIVANTEFIHKLRILRKNERDNEFEERYDYIKSSVLYDINSLIQYLQGLVLSDLSHYPYLKDLIRGQNFKLAQFVNNKVYKSENYSLFQGLDVFLSQIKEFIIDDNLNFYNKDIYFFGNYRAVSTDQRKYEKNFDAIFLNFFINIIHYLEKINQANFDESKTRINEIHFILQMNFISYLIVFVLIVLVIFVVNRVIYLVHLNLLQFYYLPPDDFIQNTSNYLKKVKKIIFNLKNDDRNIDNFEDPGKNNSTAKKRNFIKSDIFKARKSILLFNNNLQDNQKKNSIFSFKNLETTNPHKSEANLINNITTTSNNENQNLMDKPNPSLPNNVKLSWETNFYSHFFKTFIKLFFKGISLHFSFSYIFLAYLILHPQIRDVIHNLSMSQYSLIYKTESEFLLVSSVLLNIFKNSTIIDINNIELNKEYLNTFMKFHYSYTYNNYLNDEIKQKLKQYNSNKFCDYFMYNTGSKLLDLPISSEECKKSELNLGIQIYVFKLKNSVEGIYHNFKYSSNRSLDYLKASVDDFSFKFAEVSFDYYIRNYTSDMKSSILSYFEYIIKLSFWVSLGILIMFSIHISVLMYLAFFVIYRKIHFYFEKLRILFCILPENKNENDEKLRRIFQEYY